MKILHTMDQITKKGIQKSEYLSQVKKSFEWSIFKKTITHGTFATSVLTPMIAILDARKKVY